MADKQKRKKLLLSVTAVTLTAAIGAGIWLGNRSGEPVNVYSFQNIGMTEFWGDVQESYGPVTTDRIQTEFLSDTQTVTEVNVKEGDLVKKGDVLFSYDTTLNSLSLERKRLEMDKIRVQIQAAEDRLREILDMVPYEPPGEAEPEEPDLGAELKDTYRISDRVGQDQKIYTGQSRETAIICWLKEEASITDALLQELWITAEEYRKSAVGLSGTEAAALSGEQAPAQVSGSAADTGEITELYNHQGRETADIRRLSGEDASPDSAVREAGEEKIYPVEGTIICNGEVVERDTLEVGQNGYLIRDSYTHLGKTYWLESAEPRNALAPLNGLKIEPYPQEESGQDAWEARWKDGVEIRYIRDVTLTGARLNNNALVPVGEGDLVELEAGKEAVLIFQSAMGNAPPGTKRTFSVTPADGILHISRNGDSVLLSGKPEEATGQPTDYTVTARYSFDDNHGQNRAVEVSVSFSVSVVPQAKEKMGECYVVFKSTRQNFLKGIPVIWQGAKVTAYADGTFDMQLFDAAGFADHTVPSEDAAIDLPQIDPNAIYTEAEIMAMRTQCYATIREQNEKLKMAEYAYQIMERELDDGKVCAEIDGKVFSLLTEEEARAQKQPLLKVSGGGGFYVEGSISELEIENLQLGQEVTVTDWSNGGTYTGNVISIGDFPTDNDSWNGMGNPNASYYPFQAFVEEEADLQAGSYVSITYSTASAEQGIYLEKAFVRSEKGQHWIYVRGDDGLLEKRNIRVGKVLWGSYYEILSDLSDTDFLAFPYGKNVKQGAPTVESDISVLYGY